MRRPTSAPSRFDQESRSKSEHPARAAGWPPQPSCPQRSSRQAVLVVPNDFIVGQMFIDSRQGVEVCEDLGELGAVDTTLPTFRHSPGQSFIHRALDRLRQGLASALGELADFGLRCRVLDDHAHFLTIRMRHSIVVYTISCKNIYSYLVYGQGLAGRFLPLDRPKPDVAAAEALRPLNLVDRFVGARLSLRHRLAERTDVEHSAAIGEDAAAFATRAGVEDFDAFNSLRVGEAHDLRALDVVARVAPGGHHDGERR